MILDPFTYGKSLAAQNLAKILNLRENKSLCATVTKILVGHNTLINQIDISNLNKGTKITLLLLLRKEFFNQLDYHKKKFQLDIYSHMSNVYIANWREALTGNAQRNDFRRKKKHEN